MKKRFEYGCDICDDRIIVLESNDNVDFAQMASYALDFGWQYAQLDEGDILICPDCSEKSAVPPINSINRPSINSIKKISVRMGLASIVSLLFVISISLIMLWSYDKSQDTEINLAKTTPAKNTAGKPDIGVDSSQISNETSTDFYLEADETADVDPIIISKIEADPEKYADKIEAIELLEDYTGSDIDRELTISKLKSELEQALTSPPKLVTDNKNKEHKGKLKNNYTLIEKNIKGSLNTTALEVDLSDKQALEIGKTFEDLINFKKDLTTKDTLSILFNDKAPDTDNKEIKLIQLTSRGKTYQAVKDKTKNDSFKLLETEEEFADLLDLIAQNKSGKLTIKKEQVTEEPKLKTSLKEKPAPKTKVNETSTPLTHGKYAYYTGKINKTLSSSAEDVGLGFTHVKRLMHIFSYSVNFKRLVSGDRFSVIFDKKDLKKKGTKAKILAAEFVVKGKHHQRVRYTDKKGKAAYYMLDSKGPTSTVYKTTGGSKSGFLRYPLRFKRVSSHFNLRRRHPISRRIRPHKGTDFAAPRGTPVKATGNGVVSYSGWQRGYGRVVKIKHNNGKYETIYGHLSRINKRAKKGRTVKRGKVIGYVGSTGNSTGNHLHYEFRVRNRAVNPLRVKLPKAGKVIATKVKDAKEYKRFKQQANLMKAELKYCRKKNQVLASAKDK